MGTGSAPAWLGSSTRWRSNSRLHQNVLLDGLYDQQQRFHDWLDRDPHRARKLVLISADTHERALAFGQASPHTAYLESLPDDLRALKSRERRARLLVARSQYDHMAMVTGRKVIPLALALTPLHSLKG